MHRQVLEYMLCCCNTTGLSIAAARLPGEVQPGTSGRAVCLAEASNQRPLPDRVPLLTTRGLLQRLDACQAPLQPC